VRSGNKNKLRDENQQRILGWFTAREDVQYIAALVPNERIAENDYNVSVSSYVQAEDTREAVDITALNAEIAEIVARQQDLRKAIDAIVADLEGEQL
jgi:type I restriction enzyme M protein